MWIRYDWRLLVLGWCLLVALTAVISEYTNSVVKAWPEESFTWFSEHANDSLVCCMQPFECVLAQRFGNQHFLSFKRDAFNEI